MARKRTKELLMDKIREVLRLALQCKRSNRETGKICRISHSTVRDYIIRVNQAGLTYDQIKNMDDLSKSQPRVTARYRFIPVSIVEIS